MEKRIELDNNRIILLSIYNELPKKIVIQEAFMKNGDIEKDYTFYMCNDFSFEGSTSDYDLHKLSFEFDFRHPLYLALNNLLDKKQELLIDDDDTNYEFLKYMRIYKDNDIIYVEFINNLDSQYDKYDYDNFSIFIKNIFYDLRSKIDCKNEKTKLLLQKFFMEAISSLTNYDEKKLIKK